MPQVTLNSLGVAQTLDLGVSVLFNPTPLTAADANPTIHPQTPLFCVQKESTLNLVAQGLLAVPTTVTVNVLVSYDGGTTWQTFATGLPLVAATVAAAAEVIHLVPGALYAISCSTVTLGSASTGFNLQGSIGRESL